MKWYRAERETPYVIHSAASVLSTSVDRSRRATTIAKHSREYSSTTVKIFQWAAVVRAVCHEVVRPDVMALLGTTANAGPVSQPQPASFRLFLQHVDGPC